MSNRLREQSSPYLLQHANNPVDWFPWGQEAFTKAERENKPIFLSIGYSTCHWCHVMAEESFENNEIAEILNRDFVAIKVDREERPDIDSVYMTVCQALTGSGGWPMSIFMTAQQKPFFAGTYFPKESRYGMVGFGELLCHIADQWKNNKAALLESSENILAHIRHSGDVVQKQVNVNLPELAVKSLCASFDEKYGGFGEAPKFPIPHNLLFLMFYSHIYHDGTVLGMAEMTLEQMRRGGIFDHIGYGFARYSTDRFYLVPHFEKMLYDNALLIIAYCVAYKACDDKSSKTKLFLDTAEKTTEYLFREMMGSEGEFYSAQDADSDGEEGKYYVWTKGEICEVLGEERGGLFCAHFGITERGNFEGNNIPNLLNGNRFSDEFDREREVLYQFRCSRARLHLDDKILTSWNSLMICAMTMLYRVTGKQKYLSAAKDTQCFIEKNLTEGNILYVSCRYNGKRRSVKGFLDEYACYTAALISLYDATAQDVYLERAMQICSEAERQFVDEHGGYFLYGAQNSPLITRPKETYDGALPSGNSVMAYCLVRLFQITGREEYHQRAEKQLSFLSAQAEHYPAGYGMFLFCQLLYFHPFPKITVVLSEKDTVEIIFPKLPLGADVEFLSQDAGEYTRMDGKTTYYVCREHMCLPPTTVLEL